MTNPSVNTAKPLVVAEGISLLLPAALDVTYQIIPDYDDSEHVIAGWFDNALQYFINFTQLPAGWLEADAWITAFSRDMNAASEHNTFAITEQGGYTSEGGYELTFIRFSFVPKGETVIQHQLIHFITDRKRSYLACATPLSDIGNKNLDKDVISILQSIHSSANVVPLIRKNDDGLQGVWLGEYTDAKKGVVDVVFELKSDLTFTRKEGIAGSKANIYSGVWSLSQGVVQWTYLYGKPSSEGGKTIEEERVLVFSGNALELVSDSSRYHLIMRRA